MPDNLVIPFFHFNRKNKLKTNITMNKPCIATSEKFAWMGLNKMAIPKTAIIFIILEPMIFPMIKSVSPCLAAAKDVVNSGNDVPNATMDMPIIRGGIPKIFAIPVAPVIKIDDPNAKPIIPRTILIQRK